MDEDRRALQRGYGSMYEKLISDLNEIRSNTYDPITRTKQSLAAARAAAENIRKTFLEDPPILANEEIAFFKNVKPRFYSLWQFWNDVLNIEIRVPFGNKEILLSYFESHLIKLSHLFNDQLDFCIYIRNDETRNDEYYFTRKHANGDNATPYEMEFDKTFSTRRDYLLSRMIANEMLADYLSTRIAEIKGEQISGRPPLTDLQWTSQKVHLAELIYAFHASGVFNNSQLGIEKLSRGVSELFKVDFPNIYKTFEEIRIRKKSRTAFLDSLRTNLIRRMEEDDLRI